MADQVPPPPPGWSIKESTKHPGTFYYIHQATGQTQWERPEPHAPPLQSSSSSNSNSQEVHVLHLLKKHTGSRRPSSWRQDVITRSKEEARNELGNLRNVIVAGGEPYHVKFRDLASKESDCSSAKKGGDLGQFGRGAMQKPFEEASFALPVNGLSEIISTDSGEHIILRLA